MKLFIIGAGPAGISAALYAKRANIDTTILYKDSATLNTHHLIDNYYGFLSNNGSQLYEIGLSQARALEIPLISEEVIDIKVFDKIIITTNKNDYEADALIIATGSSRNIPPIRNFKNFEGKGISYCAACDGFFYRNKNLAVLGNSIYAAHEAEYLKNLTDKITIFTNGKEIEVESLKQFNIVEAKIKSFEGDDRINKIVTDKDEYECEGVFVALGSAGALEFSKKLGLDTLNNKIVVDKNMKTNIEGIYACGDCTEGLAQVSKAVYEGAVAATDVIKYLNAKKRSLNEKK